MVRAVLAILFALPGCNGTPTAADTVPETADSAPPCDLDSLAPESRAELTHDADAKLRPPLLAIQILCPAVVLSGEPVPVVLRIVEGDRTALHLSGVAALSLDAGSLDPSAVHITRGVGSVTTVLTGDGAVSLVAVLAGRDRDAAQATGDRQVQLVADLPFVEVSGALTGDALDWTADTEIRVTGDVEIPAGETLTIHAGARVRLGAKVNVLVAGTVVADGTAAEPILFAPLAPDEPWGGITHQQSSGEYRYVLLTGGGADPDMEFGHSHSQPVVLAQHGEVTFSHCALIDNPGKALGSSSSRVTVEDSLISRCDTGGEHKQSAVTFRRTHFLEMPSADNVPADDDNDGIYVSGALEDASGAIVPSLIQACVFAAGKDDGIDHNGATLAVRDSFIEGFFHEGIACSKAGRVDVVNTFVRQCEQGIEAGYGAPEVVVDHCVVTDNDVGFRFGDSYDWEVDGSLTVTNSISVLNHDHNVWNFVNLARGPMEDRIDISYSMVDDPAWDGKQLNLPGLPLFDPTWHLAPGSPGKAAASDGSDMGLLP